MLKRPHTPPAQRAHSARGFVLMDVLVAILLFSVGVLALIGLQSAMTRSQTEAKARADASYLASELVGQIWSDISQISLYTEAQCESFNRCKEWQDRVAANLPKGEGVVAADVTTGDVTITITWTTPSGDEHKYVTLTNVTSAGG